MQAPGAQGDQPGERPGNHQAPGRFRRQGRRLYRAGKTGQFVYYNMKGDKFCYRGKPNFYKKQLENIERDGWIEIDLDDRWIDRFKVEEVKDYARGHRNFRLRVIKVMKSELR